MAATKGERHPMTTQTEQTACDVRYRCHATRRFVKNEMPHDTGRDCGCDSHEYGCDDRGGQYCYCEPAPVTICRHSEPHCRECMTVMRPGTIKTQGPDNLRYWICYACGRSATQSADFPSRQYAIL